MHRIFFSAVVGLFVSTSFLASQQYPNIAPTDPKSPADELKTFKLPPGFEVQLVASEPDIRKPIQMAFDAKGRLWVTTSEEYPFPAQGHPGKDRLYVLEDFGPDGKAKKVSVFADDLNIPIGVVPLPDGKSVLVSSIDPGEQKDSKLTCWIWKLTDTDGDGKYDKKEKLYGPFGCDDTHGMNNSYTLMPDGWVYACHGFKNDSRPKGKDGHEIFMNSGNTFRFRPDGSRIEIWTYGQVNPFGIAVDPSFNLYTADCHSKPITQLIHGATYQSFSKPDDGLGFAPHVTIHGHDSTALCGLVYYAADHFPKEYLDHMFLGNVTSNCINLDKIEFAGSTPKGIDKGQFLSSNDLWFRPTDIKLGPDGALYFADFYNRIIGHYEVDLKHPGRDKLRGRVWRIIYRGADGRAESPRMMADLTTAKIEVVADALSSPNITQRLLATQQMIARHAESQKQVDADRNEGIAHAKWLCLAQPSFTASAQLRNLQVANMGQGPFNVVHELKIAAVIAQWEQPERNGADLREEVLKYLVHADIKIRRAAVEALIAHPSARNIRPLIRLLAETPSSDDHLRMAIRIALRALLVDLPDWNKTAGNTPWSTAEMKALAELAPAVPNPAAANFLMSHLQELGADTGRLPAYVEHAARYIAEPGATLKAIETFRPEDFRLTILMLNAYRQALQKRGLVRNDSGETALAGKLCAAAIASNDGAAVQAGIELAAASRVASAYEPLFKFAQARERPEVQRAAALSALATVDAAKTLPLLIQLLNDAAETIVVRERAAQVLTGLNRADAFDELTKAFQAAPARLQTAMAVAMTNSPQGAEALLIAVEKGKASARLLQDKAVQTKLHERRLPKVGERIAALTKGLPSADDRLLKLIINRHEGFAKGKPDALLGKQVFTKNCANCHQLGNEGTKIGPQLDGIGGRGLDRLLEDVLDPNRNVDAAFRTTVVTLTDGKSISGLALREEGQILVLADDKGKEVRIPKGDIDEKRLSLLSPMPANLAETIAEKDFLDLLAYLLAQRAKAK